MQLKCLRFLLAKIFQEQNLSRTKSLVERNAKDVTEIRKNNKTLAYIINYEGGGFNIISATKVYSPILAFSEKGNLYEVEYDRNPFFDILEPIVNDIQEELISFEKDSTNIDLKKRILWREYENTKTYNEISTKKDHGYWRNNIRNKIMSQGGVICYDQQLFKGVMASFGTIVNDITGINELQKRLDTEYSREKIPSFIWSEVNQRYFEDIDGPFIKTH